MSRPFRARLVYLFLLFAAGGCFKEYSENLADEETITVEAALGQQEADDALDVVYQAEVFQRLHPHDTILLGTCVRIYNDSVNKILTVDFGASTTTCSSFFGRTRSGKIISAYASVLGDTMANRTVTFEDYSVNGKKVDGAVSISDFAFNGNNQLLSNRSMNNMTVTFADGLGITYNGTNLRTWVSGMGDTLEYNNIYSLNGGVLGVTSTGRNFTQLISQPVLINFFCATSLIGNARTAGVLDLTKLDGYPDRTRRVDYGDSICDKSISVTTFRRTFGAHAD